MSKFATIEEEDKFYRGATFAGPGGAPIKILSLTFSEGKDEKLQFHLASEVSTKLIDPYNPAAGVEPLPETQPISILVTVKEDMKQTLDTLNRAFRLSKPLVDEEGWFARLTEDHPDSVLDQIVGKNGYVFAKASPRPKGDGLIVYWNLHAPSKQEKPTLASLKKFLPKMEAAAKEPTF